MNQNRSAYHERRGLLARESVSSSLLTLSLRPSVLILSLMIAGMIAGVASAGIFEVNSTGDAPDLADDGLCATGGVVNGPGGTVPECTFRAAIEESNRGFQTGIIRFTNVPTSAGFATISPATPLPTIVRDIQIQGSTAPGFDTQNPFPTPIIQLNGGGAPAGTNGLTFDLEFFNASTLTEALGISAFDGDGIEMRDGNHRVEGCQIGISRGAFYVGNTGNGIRVTDSGNFEIGKNCSSLGCGSDLGNVISSNGGDGIRVELGFGSIAGNRIGTDRSGTATFVAFGGATPNQGWGVNILPSAGGSHSIGESTSAPDGGNLISGNKLGGISAGSSNVSIYGNKIGTNASGSAALPNEGPGIHILDGFTSDLIVGGMGVNEGNLISGNLGDGILAEGGQEIVGNTIGLTLNRSAKLGNDGIGLRMSGNEIRVERNFVSGNSSLGILDNGFDNEILANWVGTNEAGDDLGNGNAGIQVNRGRSQVGRRSLGNIVGHNPVAGIILFGFDATAQGNWIGTDPMGRNLGNFGEGMIVLGDANVIGGSGGRSNGDANVIGFNQQAGISLSSQSADTRVEGNFVGTDSSANVLPNGDPEITVNGFRQQIGAALEAADEEVESSGNVIRSVSNAGIRVPSSSGIVMRGNVLLGDSTRPGIDLASSGPTPNDLGDADEGANDQQNYPEFDGAQTQWNESTGQLEVRYRVTSNLGDATYPLKVDFYLRTTADARADLFIGSDEYPAASATQFRLIGVDPVVGVGPSDTGALVATATDADGNTSELSTQLVYVPEPSLVSGVLLLTLGAGFNARQRLRHTTNRGSSDPIRRRVMSN